MIKKYVEFSDFLLCTFNLDWDLDGNVDTELVEKYVRGNPEDILDECTSEFDHYLRHVEENNIDVDGELDDLFLGYDYTADGFNGLEWLRHLRNLLDQFRGETGANQS